jgi:hypothetical protein
MVNTYENTTTSRQPLSTTNAGVLKVINSDPIKHLTKVETHVKSLVTNLIRWCHDHQASLSSSVRGLCEGTLTKKTASSLRAILAAYQPETFLVASDLLAQVENQYGPVPDVLASAEAVLTRRGYVLNAVFSNGTVSTVTTGGAL